MWLRSKTKAEKYASYTLIYASIRFYTLDARRNHFSELTTCSSRARPTGNAAKNEKTQENGTGSHRGAFMRASSRSVLVSAPIDGFHDIYSQLAAYSGEKSLRTETFSSAPHTSL